MMYDSDDSDEYYVNAHLLDDFRWHGYDGYDSDDDFYGGHHFGYYDSDDYNDIYSCSDESDFNRFFETGLRPGLFPDVVKFDLECARRICWMERKVSDSFSVETFESRMENPLFELLWESLHYLQTIIEIGKNRIDSCGSDTLEDSPHIKKIYDASIRWFPMLGARALTFPNNWLVWVNDILIEILQKAIPFQLPYTAWSSIIKHLSVTKDSNCKILLTDLQTISGEADEVLEAIERDFLQRSIHCTNLLIKDIFMLLYCNYSEVEYKKITMQINRQLQLLNTTMLRLACCLDNAASASKCLNFRVKSIFPAFIEDILDYDPPNDLDLRKVVRANTDFRYNSPMFAMLTIDTETTGKYNLLTFDKSLLGSLDSIKAVTCKDAVLSTSIPILFCSGTILAAISTEGSLEEGFKWFLQVWDCDDECSPQMLYKYKLKPKELLTGSSVIISKITGIGEIHNLGMTEIDGSVTVALSLKFSVKDEDGVFPCCVILTFDSTKKKGKKTRLPNISGVFIDAQLLSLHKSMAFIVHYEKDHMICLHDLDQNYKVLTKLSWDNANPWSIRFNCNPCNDTCLLYRKNEIQVRKLDADLTFIKDVSVILENSSGLNEPDFQFYDSTVYGHRNYVQGLEELEVMLQRNMLLSGCTSPVQLLQTSVYSFDEHFCFDLDDSQGDVVYLDVISAAEEFSLTDLEANESFMIFVTGFNTDGEIVQIALRADAAIREITDLTSFCTEISVATIEFCKTFRGVIDAKVPRTKEGLQLYKEEQEREAKHMQYMAELNAKAEMELEKRRQKTEMEIKKREESMANAQEAIDSRTFFTTKIKHWKKKENYGFADIVINGQVQSVFVHKTSVTPVATANKLRKGAGIIFNIKWDHSKPRPKAYNVVLCS